MKTIYLLNTVLFLWLVPSVFSQKLKIDSNAENEYFSVLKPKEVASILTTFVDGNALNKKNAIEKNRTTGVLIQQIGNYNTSAITVSSRETSISLTQNGDNNDYMLVKNAAKIKANIIQNGNSNSINDYTKATNYETNSQMMQNGNNLNIKSIGTNSISKDMKVNQAGNGASIIIINKSN